MHSPARRPPCLLSPGARSSSIVKAGTAFKKGSGAGFLVHRHNWKPRYLVLTLNALLYYTHQDGRLKGSVDLTDVLDAAALEIMPHDCVKTGHSAASEWRLRITTPTRQFVMAAACERDMHEWIEAFLDVFRANERRQSGAASMAPQEPSRHRELICEHREAIA
ncbi:hypothetical protein H310_14195 [Aphanomyces invadans]|uniref:PH domain-containing protein n=1 Tax=Aphanomyces invadans TaxID=157072 RepID=A0A024TAM1_9STRA|nr:hypothetical protein H310_14195 [Aphanomyces invadans]ETV91195.1 hypothetical protein H310_14195 [Aphanomyces invadans]|eukprot:XP_008880226.1 hypothetical protein H310_14195 [Aphanomyces invadans]